MRTSLRFAILALLLTTAVQSLSAPIAGDLDLYPEGCQSSPDGICKLGSELTYTSWRNGYVWKTNAWSSDKAQSGTTDGASIPGWLQPIIGDPYEAAYLKAAIIHDHYCFEENQVRTWRDTHLMFYDAMRDSGVSGTRAKVMYFAVYLAGPKWVRLVEGENCGRNCIRNLAAGFPSGVYLENTLLNSDSHRREIRKLHREFENGDDYSIQDLEARAHKLDPQFFYEHGNEYVPTGPDDSNLMPRL